MNLLIGTYSTKYTIINDSVLGGVHTYQQKYCEFNFVLFSLFDSFFVPGIEIHFQMTYFEHPVSITFGVVVATGRQQRESKKSADGD